MSNEDWEWAERGISPNNPQKERVMKIELKMPATEDEIKSEIRRFSASIKTRENEIKMLKKAVQHYRDQCKHKGQTTGHNERDGFWATPCTVCGDCS